MTTQTNNSKMIYPEMGQTTNATIEYKVSHSGGLYLTTDLELKGRGINKCGDGSDHARGKKTYQVTKNAWNKIKANHDHCYIASL